MNNIKAQTSGDRLDDCVSPRDESAWEALARTEAALRESEERLRAIIDNTPSLIYLKDIESRVLVINKAYQDYYGVSQEDAFGSEGFEWQSRENVKKLRENDLKVLAGGRPVENVIEQTDTSGNRIVMRSTKFPVRDATGSIVGIGGIASNITAQRQAEEAAARQSAILQTTLDHMLEGISVFDADQRLVAFNKVFLDLYGFPEGSINIGTSFADVVRHLATLGHYGEGDIDEIVRLRVEKARDGVGRQYERTGRNGRILRVMRKPLPDGGFVITYTDITPQKKAERALLETAARADAANVAKSAFLANMSHELRTPLNAIIGLSYIVSSEMLGPLGVPQYKEYAKDIHGSGEHLLSIINDILDLSKIEAEKDELVEEPVDVAATAEASLTMVRRDAEEKGVALENLIPADICRLTADQRKLRQILINLLSNAVKFTGTGGRVTIAAWIHSEQGFTLKISDTGIGMATEDIPVAMSKFGQVDDNLDRKYEGTGLGLPLTKSLVEMHGGTLDIDSEVGKGTAVRVRLPAWRIVAVGPDRESA